VIKVSSFSLHLKVETDAVTETLCPLVFTIPEDGQSPKPNLFWGEKAILRRSTDLHYSFMVSGDRMNRELVITWKVAVVTPTVLAEGFP
jgi:hypothetical protein